MAMAARSGAFGTRDPDHIDAGGRPGDDHQGNGFEPVTLSEALRASNPGARILLVSPSPINDPTRLHLETELREIFGALDQLRVDVDIVRLDPPTLETLRVALATDEFDVVHLGTHCTSDTLEFEDEDGTAVCVPCHDFADAFSSRACVLVLNGCSTEAIADRIAGAARSVTTIAISGAIARSDAARVLRSIYEMLFSGHSPADAARSAAGQLRRQRAGNAIAVPLVTARGAGEDQALVSVRIGDAKPTYHRCSPPTNLPPGGRAFFDREHETLELHELLCASESSRSVIGVTGITGTGKTAMVQAAARRYSWRFPGGVGYFSLRGEFSVDLLADVFGWTRQRGRDLLSLVEAARTLAKGRYLLIFDDVNDAAPAVLDEVTSLLADWDTTLGGRAVLVSQSRTPELQKLVGGNWLTVDRLPADAASDLLVHHLPGGHDALRATGAEAVEVTRLCLGHPKTIESAATLLSLGQSWNALREDLLRFAGEGPLGANDEMLGRIVSSLEQRQPAVRDLLDAWSVFDEHCREATWRRVASPAGADDPALRVALNQALNDLQGANLIDRYDVNGETRCRMHPLVSRHLRPRHERLSDEKLRRHVRAQLDEQTALAQAATAGDLPLDEASNLRRTLVLAADLRLWEPILAYARLVVGDENARLTRRGPWRLARRLLEHGNLAAAHLGDIASQTELTLVEGMVHYRLADFDLAARAYERAVELAEESGDLTVKVRALRGSGQVHYRLGDYDAALGLYARAGLLVGDIGEEAVAAIDHQIGKILYRKRQLSEARKVLGNVRNVRSRVGSKRDLAKTIHELARVEQADGRSAEAHALYEEALDLEQRVGDPVMEQATLYQLGCLALEEHKLVDARTNFRRSREISERLDDQVWLAHAAWAEAQLAHAEGAGDAVAKADLALNAARTLGIGLAHQIEDWLAAMAATKPQDETAKGK